MTKKDESYHVEKKALVGLIEELISEVSDVHSIKKGLLGKEIKIKNSGKGKILSLGVVVKRGVSIPIVVEEIQKKLKQELETTLGTPIERINVTIKGIRSSS